MLERLSEAAVCLISAVGSGCTPTMHVNAAARTTATASATASATGSASSSTARRFLPPLRHATATLGSSSSTSQTRVNPNLQFETELQPWRYRRANDTQLGALGRISKEQTEQTALKARQASEVWRKFWT
jgi:hypothetical protein